MINYRCVHITQLKRRDFKYLCNNEHGYKEHLKTNPDMVEIIGAFGQQIKPAFDLDAYEEFDINSFINHITPLFPNKKIVYANRKKRKHKKGFKYSFRVYVVGVRILSKNLKKFIIDNHINIKFPCLDMSIYDKNRVLYTPCTTEKEDKDTGKNIKIPALEPVNCSIFDCCASYIEEEYEDWDVKFKDEVVLKFDSKLNDDISKPNDCSIDFSTMMTKFSEKRATDYNDWIYPIIALINLCHRKIISRGQVYDLADLFSKISPSYDPDGVIKTIDDNINRFNGKGYGIKYLLECLKVDDPEYYTLITKKDLMIDGANDDIGAAEIVVNHYRDDLIICNGTLYVRDNNVWVSNEKQADRLLIDKIGKLDIKFYGVDGKRKYHYNKSIRHIKDCIICVKANKTIINDNFYDDMIKNNKGYLPFNNGIYCFGDKKLYKYEELPSINFTFKILRNFPIFNQDNHNRLMTKVIIPIYPNEDERNYNAHCKSRALAGHYNDKKWYAYIGSRDSGKGTETNILKSAFGDFVKDFNANCLIYNKFGNPDQAKALSWVVDKKNSRIVISNEIKEDATLNGTFIKTLSGGDAIEARKNYQDEINFTPQFTMFLNCNRIESIEPKDAMENLEQFEYKTKFVNAEDLIENAPFFKLKDDTIKDFIKEDEIIDAYTLYILNAYSDPRIKTPESVKISTEINKGDEKMSIEKFISKNFITTNDNKDRMHTHEIHDILTDNSYKITSIETGRLINRIGIGKYNRLCNKNGEKHGGYDYIKYIGN